MPLEFQPTIDHPTNIYLAACLASEAYGDLATLADRLPRLGSTLQPSFTFDKQVDLGQGHLFDTQGLIVADERSVALAFRGTETTSWADILTDLSFNLVDGFGGRVHQGFYRAHEKVALTIAEHLEPHRGKRLYITGHSLGGALATLAAAQLHEHFPVAAVYTFGQPAVGNQAFAEAYPCGDRHLRFINNQNELYDPVPLVPLQEQLSSYGILAWILTKLRLAPLISDTIYAHVERACYVVGPGQPYGATGPGLFAVVHLNNWSLLLLLLTGRLTLDELKKRLTGLGTNHAMALYLAYAKTAAGIVD